MKISDMLRMILSRLEGKHASCRFSTAGATECDRCCCIRGCTACLAVHVVCELEKGGATGVAGHWRPHDVPLDQCITISFPRQSDNFVEVQQYPSQVHIFVLEFCVLLCPYPSVSLQLSAECVSIIGVSRVASFTVFNV